MESREQKQSSLQLLREQLDPTVKTSAEAERLTGLKVITEIPS